MANIRDILKREPKIGYMCNYHEDETALRNSHIKHMKDIHFDSRIYVRGRFPNFPKTKNKDKSEEVIMSLPNSVIIGEDIMSQVDKQNLAFQKAAELGIDILLQIDADEWVEMDREILINGIDEDLTSTGTFQFMVKWNNIESSPPYDPTVDRMPRLFLYPWALSCEKIHWHYYGLGFRLIVDDKKLAKGVTMYHDDGVRDKKRNDLMWQFQKIDMKREGKIIEDQVQQTLRTTDLSFYKH